MTASTWIARAKDRVELPRVSDSRLARNWIGVDFSGEDEARPARRLLPLLVLALVVALGVSALRIDLIRTRYAMASVLAEEKALIEEQRSLIVKRRQLRDPVELATLARERGFRPLSAGFSLPDPFAPSSNSIAPPYVTLPSMTAADGAPRNGGAWK